MKSKTVRNLADLRAVQRSTTITHLDFKGKASEAYGLLDAHSLENCSFVGVDDCAGTPGVIRRVASLVADGMKERR
jgi:hypothetical protein